MAHSLDHALVSQPSNLPTWHNIQQLPISVSVGHQPAIHSKQSQRSFRISNISQQLQTCAYHAKENDRVRLLRKITSPKIIYMQFI